MILPMIWDDKAYDWCVLICVAAWSITETVRYPFY